MSNRDYKNYTRDILEHIEDIEEFIENINYDEFIKNKEKITAVVGKIIFIGEAVDHLPDEVLEKYPDMAWNEVVAMRNRLVHGYFDIDYRIIWEVVNADIPRLKKTIEQLMDLP